jgi:hypothetical protein
LRGFGVSEEFDSASIIEFPLHKTRKPMPEITAEHGSAIIRTLTAAGMDNQAAKMIVEAEPLPTFCSACGFIHSHCACWESDGA